MIGILKDPLYKKAIGIAILYVILVLATRYGGGIVIGGMVAAALICILRKRVASAIILYALILLLIEINPNIVSLEKYSAGVALRFGLLIISMALTISGMARKGTHRLPMGFMWFYLAVAALSSATGWAPTISYLKMLNFAVFFAGIYIGTQNMDRNPDEVLTLRAGFFAIGIFVIIGSLVLLPFPGMSTLDGLKYNRNYGVRLSQAEINVLIKEMQANEGETLYCGITHQSQILAPLVAVLMTWILCDMLFIERKFRWQHILMILLAFPLLYKTRSRVGLVTIGTAMSLVYFYLPRKIRLSPQAMSKLKQGMTIALLLVVSAMTVAEFKSGFVSKWIRKTDDVKGDNRSLAEAFTSSRARLVDENLEYFAMNPLLGMGFQVNFESDMYVKESKGLILSAPIEKGVAPLMILGETGIVGGFVFILFLISFYNGCQRRRLYITAVFFTIMLATNMGEATIFSPGGLGGELWMICVVGGFAMDNVLSLNKRMAERIMF